MYYILLLLHCDDACKEYVAAFYLLQNTIQLYLVCLFRKEYDVFNMIISLE